MDTDCSHGRGQRQVKSYLLQVQGFDFIFITPDYQVVFALYIDVHS